MLSFDEWITKLQPALDNPTDAAIVVSALTEARDAYKDGYAELLAAQEKNVSLTADNEKLTNTNRDLFLRIGQQMNQTLPSSEPTEEDRAETIKIEDLFKEE